MAIKTIEVKEAEKRLKELVTLVTKGEHIVLSENNTPIAQLAHLPQFKNQSLYKSTS